MTQVTLTATFTAAGPFTWTCPAGVTSVTAECTGAGGGGGSAAAASGSNGGGGGGGEAALEPALGVTAGLVYSGMVGAGGAAQTAGGDTSFTGDGSVAVVGHGGGAGSGAGASAHGAAGAGGDGSVNSVSAAGGSGDIGASFSAGGWSLVQQSAAQTNTGTNTLPSPSTAGNLLVAVVGSASTTGLNIPTNWSLGGFGAQNGANEIAIFCYPGNPGGLSSFTFTGGGTLIVTVAEFTCPNVASVTGVNDWGGNSAGAGSSVSVTTGSGGGTAQAGDLVIAAGFEHLNAASAITWTDPSGFTQMSGLLVGSTANHCYAAYELSDPSAGILTETITSSVASTLASGWTGQVATFSLPAPGAGGGGGGGGVSTAQGFPGNNAAGTVAGAASGGTYPGGGGGAGSTSGAGNGNAGSAAGGGGGGAVSTGTARTGGAGAAGQVVLTWTQSDPVTLAATTAGGAWSYTAPQGASSVTAQAWGAGGGGFNAAGGGLAASPPLPAPFSGATINRTYGLGTNRVPQANELDNLVGRPIAYVAQKSYYGSPSTQLHPDADTLALANAGCFILACIEPSKSYATGTDDFSALQTFCTNWTAAMPANSFGLIFFQETNDKGFTPASFQAYWNHYIGAVPTSIPVIYDGAGHDMAGAISLIPSAGPGRLPDAIGCDYYSTTFNGNDLTQLSAVADTLGVAFGVFEWGGSANTNPTLAGWNTYITDPTRGLYTIFASRVASGLKTAGCCYYASLHNTDYNVIQPVTTPAFPASGTAVTNSSGFKVAVTITGGNVTSVKVNGAAASTVQPGGVYQIAESGTISVTYTGSPSWSWADYKVPAMQAMYDLFATSSSAVGGAGGGGGEFAQESSLAILGGHTYSVAVGAGGAAKAAGTNTTIAGQSVTVTAHGGGVAASTGAGGAGGSGSGNTTHFSGGAGGAGGVTGGGGGGGGSSGGTAAGGNAGGAGTSTTGGAGGTAVTGGGKGGFGGKPGANGFPGLAPGGGGGGGGATAVTIGTGSDGQIVLSSFNVSGVGGTADLALSPLALAGTGSVNVSALALSPLALSGTAATAILTSVQDGPNGTGPFALSTASKAGNLLLAFVTQTTQAASTPPAGQGWQLIAAQNAGGGTGNGRAEVWAWLSNTGGLTSFAWTGGTNLRGFISEYAPPTGYIAALDTSGTASGGAGVTSFNVSTSSSNAAGDLAVAFFEDQFSATQASQNYSSTVTGWTRVNQATNVLDCFGGYRQNATTAGTQSVTTTYSTSTAQTGWAAILATFTAVPLNAATGGLALSPLGLSGTASAVVPAGTVATSGALALAPLAFQSPSQAVTFPNGPLPVVVELLINGTWTDITGYVYTRDGINISNRGRPDEASTPQPTQVTLTLNNIDQSFSPYNSASQFFPYLARNTQIRISVVNAVTSQGAWYSGYRFWGEVPSWPPQWNTAGTDVYVSITACGVLQRMRQSKFSASPLARYYANLVYVFLATGGGTSGGIGTVGGFTNSLVPAGYWPCEDGTAATSFASGIPGGSPMTWSGTPGLAADSAVAGSAPFAQLDGSSWTGTPGAFSAGGQTWPTAGTYQWLCPAGVTSIKAECWGGGGGGSSGDNVSGSGGGGGEYASATIAVTPGKSYTLVVGAGGSGGAGTFSTKPLPGTGGAASTFTGDTVTVRAHNGKGGTSTGGGAGGSGSTNAVHFSGGNGGSNNSGFGGCGGGGSAGNAAAGNAGGSNSGTVAGSGGNAKPGGGPGGNGGTGATASQGNVATPGLMPFPGPGGGGGAGGFNGSNNYSKPGGAGQAGQVTVSFGQAPTPNANVLRAVVDETGNNAPADGSFLVQALTTGTVADFHIKYHTGGNLQMNGNAGNGTQLFTSGSKSFGATTTPLLVSAELAQQNASTIKWTLTAITPGATAPVATYTGTIAGTLGSVTSVKTNSTAPFETGATGVGHVSIQYALDPLINLAPAFAAYAGELAGTRIVRLCGEQQVPVILTGNASDTPQMGPQPAGLLVDLLQDCENADLGQLFERRDLFGLGYRTRTSMQNQSTVVTLDHSGGQLGADLQPTNDDQLTRNDIIATRGNATGTSTGTTYEAILSTGPMSVQDPPNGVGLYQFSVTANLFADSQLANYAGWLLTLGTLDEFRYPVITINLARAQVSDGTFSAVAALDIGDFLQIINPAPWLPQTLISQLAFGFTEAIGWNSWTIAINAVPEDPYSSPGASPLPTW